MHRFRKWEINCEGPQWTSWKNQLQRYWFCLQINTRRNKRSKKYLGFVQCTYMIFSKTARSFKKFISNEYIIWITSHLPWKFLCSICKCTSHLYRWKASFLIDPDFSLLSQFSRIWNNVFDYLSLVSPVFL